MNARIDVLSADEKRMKQTAGKNQAATNTVILFFDLIMLFVSALLYRNGEIEFSGVLIPTIALMSSFGPMVALANLVSTLQNTFAAGNRVLDILDETPTVKEQRNGTDIAFSDGAAENVTFAYGDENVLAFYSNLSIVSGLQMPVSHMILFHTHKGCVCIGPGIAFPLAAYS